jgi:hypothetical protein
MPSAQCFLLSLAAVDHLGDVEARAATFRLASRTFAPDALMTSPQPIAHGSATTIAAPATKGVRQRAMTGPFLASAVGPSALFSDAVSPCASGSAAHRLKLITLSQGTD